MGIPLRIWLIVMNLVVGKKQRVSAEGNLSKDSLDPKSGIPQGSHIRSSLYLIYYNDIQDEIHKVAPAVKVVQFADDTQLMIEVKSMK